MSDKPKLLYQLNDILPDPVPLEYLYPLIAQCVDWESCLRMERALKHRGLWRSYATILTGTAVRPENVVEADEVLLGYPYERRRAAAWAAVAGAK